MSKTKRHCQRNASQPHEEVTKQKSLPYGGRLNAFRMGVSGRLSLLYERYWKTRSLHYGLMEDSKPSLWLLVEDSKPSLWLLVEDSMSSLWLFVEDSKSSLWVLVEDSKPSLWVLVEDSKPSLWVLVDFSHRLIHSSGVFRSENAASISPTPRHNQA